MALTPQIGLETHPAGTTNVGGIINANWERVDEIFDPALSSGDAAFNAFWKALVRNGTLPTGVAHLEWNPSGTAKPLIRAGLAALTPAGTVDVAFNAARNLTLTLNADTTFTWSALAAGREVTVIITADASTRALTFPSGIIWSNATPASLPAGKVAIMRLISTTAANSGVVGTWHEQP